MSQPPQNENGNNVTANTTLDEQPHATSSISYQFNSDNPMQMRSSDNSSIKNRYRTARKLTQEQICDSCEDMKNTVSKVEESLKQICEFIKRESKSENQWYYRVYKYMSQKLTSNNTEDSTCTKLLEISEFIKIMQKNINQQRNLMVQKDRDIERFQKEIKGLKSNLSRLKVSKDKLDKQILGLKEVHAKEIDDRDNSLVLWKGKLDMMFKQCKDLEENMIELNEVFNKNVTSMQIIIDEKDIKLQTYSKNLDITSNNLRQETTRRERLQEELKRIQKLVVIKKNALDREKEKFQDNLSERIKLLRDYNNAISLKDVALQAENQFVLETIEINNKIKDETAKYEEEVDNFSDSRREKSYLHIREMLVRIPEKLDAVESQNNEKNPTTINRKIP